MTLLYNDKKKPLFLSAPCLEGKSNSAVTWEHVAAYGSTASVQSPTPSYYVREEGRDSHYTLVQSSDALQYVRREPST